MDQKINIFGREPGFVRPKRMNDLARLVYPMWTNVVTWTAPAHYKNMGRLDRKCCPGQFHGTCQRKLEMVYGTRREEPFRHQ